MDSRDVPRPANDIIAGLKDLGSATCSAELSHLGIRDSHIRGPVSMRAGTSIAGPALTLQFMPRREDIFPSGEYEDAEAQVHRHVLYGAEHGDIIVVDARGDTSSGVFGEMMLTYFAGVGGEGVIVDGCLRDWTRVQKLDLGIWSRGTTPNFHMQTGIAPFAFNVPIACSNVFVVPGDVIVADDDGAVVIPAGMARTVLDKGNDHAEWEDFSRLRLSEGGDLRKYYPLRADAENEFRQWQALQRRG